MELQFGSVLRHTRKGFEINSKFMDNFKTLLCMSWERRILTRQRLNLIRIIYKDLIHRSNEIFSSAQGMLELSVCLILCWKIFHEPSVAYLQLIFSNLPISQLHWDTISYNHSKYSAFVFIAIELAHMYRNVHPSHPRIWYSLFFCFIAQQEERIL
jgi:hypothetical protein